MLKKHFVLSFAALALTLGACSNDNNGDMDHTPDEENENTENGDMDHGDMDHGDMDHSSSGEVPEGLEVEENPTYEVGDQAIIQDGHMEGMEGAEATIVGAYDTTAYAISYTPTNGGERVENHKWVIHEELLDVGNEPLEPGMEATTDADHMSGMEDAVVEIDSAEQTTVYMIDFTPTTGGEEVKNHKWVTESELSAE